MIKTNLPLQVASFRRSGTHLLLATLYRAFEWPDVAGTIGVPGRRWYDGHAETARIPWCDIFGSHDTAERVLRECEPSHLLYIMRDPAECLLSFWRFEGRKGRLEDWVFRWYPLWREHVEGYLGAGVVTVQYIELVAQPLDLVDTIAECFPQLVRRPNPELPVRECVGWLEPAGLEFTKEADKRVLLPVVRGLIEQMGGYDV